MLSIESSSIAIAGVGAGLVLLASLPPLHLAIARASKWGKSGYVHLDQLDEIDNDKQLYEDEDGTATAESEAAFSDKAPKIIITLLAAVTWVPTIVAAVWSTLQPGRGLVIESWLQVAGWVGFLSTS
jgi:hypothetical protein